MIRRMIDSKEIRFWHDFANSSLILPCFGLAKSAPGRKVVFFVFHKRKKIDEIFLGKTLYGVTILTRVFLYTKEKRI